MSVLTMSTMSMLDDDVSTCSEVIDLRSHKCPLSGLGGPIV